MKIVIDERDLNLVLEEKKNVIGTRITWDSIASAIPLTVSTLIGDYDNFFFVPGWAFRYILLVIGIFVYGQVRAGYLELCEASIHP